MDQYYAGDKSCREEKVGKRPAPASTGKADKHPLVIELFEEKLCEMETMDEARLNIVAEGGWTQQLEELVI